MPHHEQQGKALPIAHLTTGKIVGSIGVLACVLCCISVPGIATAISAMGLGFLRNDRLLFPAALVSLLLLLFTLGRSRQRHGRNTPIALGLLAGATTFFGLTSSGLLGIVVSLVGALAVVAVVIWDASLLRRCSAR